MPLLCGWPSRAGLPVVALTLVLGCASLAPDPLAGVHPYVWPRAQAVVFLLCRVDTARVGVSVPLEPPELREAVLAALRGWERAGLGLRFVEQSPEDATIRVRAARDLLRDDGRPGSAITRADCRLRPDGTAAITSALVEIALESRDWRDHVVAYTREELAGIALHEIGHALGFQGHSKAGGDEPLARSAEGKRRLGKRVLAGERIHSAALDALFARPSGTVLERHAVSRWRTEPVDRVAALAERNGWSGPYLRSGDARARVFWLAPDGEIGVWIANLEESLKDPSRLLAIPEAPAREWLDRALQPGPGS